MAPARPPPSKVIRRINPFYRPSAPPPPMRLLTVETDVADLSLNVTPVITQDIDMKSRPLRRVLIVSPPSAPSQPQLPTVRNVHTRRLLL